MRDADAAIAGVRRALKPGGRFVAEMGGHGNIAAVIVALTAVLARRGIAAGPRNPFYYRCAGARRRAPPIESGRQVRRNPCPP
jgi:hypothetical protein